MPMPAANPWAFLMQQQAQAQQPPMTPVNQGPMVPMDINPETGEPMIVDPALAGPPPPNMSMPQMPEMQGPPEGMPPGVMPSFTEEVSMKTRGGSEVQANQNRELLDLAKQYDLKNKEFLASQQLGIDQLQQDYNQAKSAEQPMNLVPLAALSDAWNPGSNLTSAAQAMGYESPAQRQARLMGIGEKLQGRKADLAKSSAESLKQQIEAYKAAKDNALGDELKRAQIQMYKASAGKPVAEKFTPGETARDQKFGREYTDWNTLGGYSAVETQLKILEEAKEALQKNGDLTGSLKAALIPSGGLQSAINPELAAIQQRVELVAQSGGVKKALGSQFTEKEAEAFIRKAFDKNLPPEENIAKIDNAIREVRAGALEKERASRYFEQNRSLRGYTPGKQSVLSGKSSDGTVEHNGKKYKVQGQQWVEVK